MTYRPSMLFTTDDPNLRVAGIQPSLRVLITKLMQATDAAAFAGANDPATAEQLRADMRTARYNLEVYLSQRMSK